MIDEALRYLGVREDPAGETRRAVAALAEETRALARPRHALRVLPVRREGEVTLLGDAVALPGSLAGAMLEDCHQAALIVCTLGSAFEARMRTEQARSMSRAAMLDALGSAWVEAGCDAAEKELSARFPGLYLTDRFSPGYGDLPLSVQPSILAATDAARRLGVTLTDSCLMLPQKTVTAVVGMADRPQKARIRGCGHCPARDGCAYREGGVSCHV